MDFTRIWNSLEFLLVTLKPFGFPFIYDPSSRVIRSRPLKYKLYFIAYLFCVLSFAMSTIIFNLHRAKYMTGVPSRLKRASYFITMFLGAVTVQIALYAKSFFLNNNCTFRMINAVFGYFGIICGNLNAFYNFICHIYYP